MELTASEIKYMRLINSKLKNADHDKIDKLIDILNKNGLCTSDNGEKFLDAIEEYRDTSQKRVSCIFCGDNLAGSEMIVCHKCLGQEAPDEEEENIPEFNWSPELDVSIQTVEEKEAEPVIITKDEIDNGDESAHTDSTKKDDAASGDNKEKPLSKYQIAKMVRAEKRKERKAKTNIFKRCGASIKEKYEGFRLFIWGISKKEWIRFWVIAVAIIAIVTTAVVIVDHMHEKPRRVLKRFEKALSQNGYSVSDSIMVQNDNVTYSILPTNESFTIFNNEKGFFTGAALAMPGNDTVSRDRQAYLMSALNQTVFEGMTYDSSVDLIADLTKQNGVTVHDGYQLLMLINQDMILYYIVDETVMDVNAVEALKNSISGELGDVGTYAVSDEQDVKTVIDGIAFIGRTVTECEAYFGEGTPVLGDNDLYFASAGVSIVFDKDTGIVSYIDEDGSGKEGAIPVAGISIGDDKATVENYLREQGIELEQMEDGKFTTYVSYNDTQIELDIYIDNGKVALVCANTLLK